jgi:hypothetical protein
MPSSTKLKNLVITLLLIGLEGLACLAAIFVIPADPTNQFAFGYSFSRLVMVAAVFVGVFLSLGFAWGSHRDRPFAQRLMGLFSSQIVFTGLLVVASISLAFCLNWRFAILERQASFLRIFPLVLFIFLASAHALILILVEPGKEKERNLSLTALLLVLGFFYVNSTLHYSMVNREYWLSDQEAYLQFAKAVKVNGFPYSGDRNFMPAYPYLQAVFLNPTADIAVAYANGKLVNIALSLALLIGLFLIVHKFLSTNLSVFFTLLIAFTLYIYKAAYVQPELLYYFLSLTTFLLMTKLLIRPRWDLAILAGLLLGLAHFIKASILPSIIIFVFFIVVKIVYEKIWLKRKWSQVNSILVPLMLVPVVFLASISPYLIESKERYGQFFYNVNSTFYIWYDSWGEAVQGTKAHGDSVGWPNILAEDIPSLNKYLHEHSLADISSRFGLGFVDQASNILFTFALISFPLFFFVALIILLFQRWPQAQRLIRAYIIPLSFVTTYFVSYLVLFAWYGPIADYADRRFTYGLYTPFLFSVLFVLHRLTTSGDKPPNWLPKFYVCMTILLATDVLLRLPMQLTSFHWFGK